MGPEAVPRSLGQANLFSSLFERLDPALPPRRSCTQHDLAAGRIAAVKQHLEWLLNARRGSALSCPELGLPDLNDASVDSADLRLRLCDDIRWLVATYEPRVKLLDVRPGTDSAHPFELHFRLFCLVPVDKADALIEIDLAVSRHDQAVKVI